MIRRGKLLGMCAESPASGARFVGRFLVLKSCYLFLSICPIERNNKGSDHIQRLRLYCTEKIIANNNTIVPPSNPAKKAPDIKVTVFLFLSIKYAK